MNSGCYYLQSRYYDAQWGRFINGDEPELLPTIQEIGSSMNLFVYCDNSPLLKIDPNGNLSRWKHAVMGISFLGSVLQKVLMLKVVKGQIYMAGRYIARAVFKAIAKIIALKTTMRTGVAMALAQNYITAAALIITAIGIIIYLKLSDIRSDLKMAQWHFKQVFRHKH